MSSSFLFGRTFDKEKKAEGMAMYLETYSMDELMELVEEKGYCSIEAVEIIQEMEQAKRRYDSLLQDCGNREEVFGSDMMVICYYRYLMEQMRRALPYDAMGGQHTIPLLFLNEFRKKDIIGKIRNTIRAISDISDTELAQEIQKFVTVQLDPQGIILYMDILGNQPAARKVGKEDGRYGKRKSIGGSVYNNFYCRTARRNPKHHP